MNDIELFRDLLIENQWCSMEGLSDTPLPGKTEHYDISGSVFLPEFELNLSLLRSEQVVVLKIFRTGKSMFSNLRLYCTNEPWEICTMVMARAQSFSKARYMDLVRDARALSDRLVFNDNGVWIEIDFDAQSEA